MSTRRTCIFCSPHIVANKADLNLGQAERIADFAKGEGARVLGHITFDRSVNEALMAGQAVVEYGRGAAAAIIKAIWREVKEELKRL